MLEPSHYCSGVFSYQMNFALSCPMRMARALVMFPKLSLLMSPLGFERLRFRDRDQLLKP
jgi:hypothetical protein